MSMSFDFSTVLTRTGATVAAAFFVLAAGAGIASAAPDAPADDPSVSNLAPGQNPQGGTVTIGGAAVGTVIAIDGINAGPDGASVGGYDFGGGQGQPWG
ncbi:MAG: hypothetical protein EOP32_28960 [Rhodococcus sp. (in: high G+C Gram-positive bacteria)]|nr:MAG: hypothetical protein EOP32_28960 [Rhodococcus sp. (in: high G+C Gram-positive bacteria)]